MGDHGRVGSSGCTSLELSPTISHVSIITISDSENEEEEPVEATTTLSTKEPTSGCQDSKSNTLTSDSEGDEEEEEKAKRAAILAWCPKSCNIGLLLGLLSGILMTTYTTMIKLLVVMDASQVVVVRGVLQLLCMSVLLMIKGDLYSLTCSDVERSDSLLLLAVSVTGGVRILLVFTSYSRLPLGDTTAILFSSPVFVMILSIFILKEKCGVVRIVAGSFLVSGIVLIAKPPILFGGEDAQADYDVIGYICICTACLISALGITLTRKLARRVCEPVTMFYLGLASTVCGAVGLLAGGHSIAQVPAWEWVLAVGIGFLGIIQQYCLIFAVGFESPSKVTVVRQLQIILAYLVQIVIFGEVPTWTSTVGSTLILITIVSITFITEDKFLYGLSRLASIFGINLKTSKEDSQQEQNSSRKSRQDTNLEDDEDESFIREAKR